MYKDSRKVTSEAWLICPNWTEVRRFTKNKKNKDKFFEYMFVDSGIVVGSPRPARLSIFVIHKNISPSEFSIAFGSYI